MNLPQNPIFIVGYPRSGTTLLQRLLAAQPGLYTFPETHYFNVIEKTIRWEKEDRESIPRSSLATVFENIEKKMDFRFSDLEIKTLHRQAEKKQLSSKTLFEYIVTRHLLNLYPEITDMASFRWMEKTPNHAHFLERILEMYPRAQVLHILRHPVPAIYSRKLKFPFNRETPVTELARRWNRMLLDVERFQQRHPAQIFTLRYEDLVQELEKQLQSVADFLNVRFDFKTLIPFKQKQEQNAGLLILPSETWKMEDLRLEIADTNDKYHGLIPAADIAAIEEIVRDNMSRCGYGSFGRE